MNDARNPEKDAENNVDQQILAHAFFLSDGHRWEKNAENNCQDIHNKG